MLICRCALGAAVATAATLMMAAGVAAAPVKCTKVAGYVIDPDPKGVNVRSAPSLKAKRIGVIPKQKRGTVVDIQASDMGWLQITRAENMEGKVTFKGPGWVHASRLGVSLQERHKRGTPLYKRAASDAGTVRWFSGPGDNWQATLISCAGGWLKVRIKRHVGWLAPNNQCGLPWTTCP